MHLDLNHRFEPLTEEVAAKVIDGEAILINLATGVYYSMDKAGALIWEMISEKRSLQQIVAELVARYQVSSDQAVADLHRLGEELLQENLVKMVEAGATPAAASAPNGAEKLPYESPVLNIYRDMGDLLALDPPTPGLDTFAWKGPDDKSK
jgi:Coenzyme PQQ synthesis protein D (PqqD)